MSIDVVCSTVTKRSSLSINVEERWRNIKLECTQWASENRDSSSQRISLRQLTCRSSFSSFINVLSSFNSFLSSSSNLFCLHVNVARKVSSCENTSRSCMSKINRINCMISQKLHSLRIRIKFRSDCEWWTLTFILKTWTRIFSTSWCNLLHVINLSVCAISYFHLVFLASIYFEIDVIKWINEKWTEKSFHKLRREDSKHLNLSRFLRQNQFQHHARLTAFQ